LVPVVTVSGGSEATFRLIASLAGRPAMDQQVLLKMLGSRAGEHKVARRLFASFAGNISNFMNPSPASAYPTSGDGAHVDYATHRHLYRSISGKRDVLRAADGGASFRSIDDPATAPLKKGSKEPAVQKSSRFPNTPGRLTGIHDPEKGMSPMAAKGLQKSRVTVDCESLTVTIDGKVIPVRHPLAARVLEKIAKAKGGIVTHEQLQTIPGCGSDGKRFDRLVAKLPLEAKRLVHSVRGRNGGYFLVLPRK